MNLSVPKSERRQSDVEYIVILQKLEKFFLDFYSDEKRRIPLLSEELVRLSMEAYNNGTMYFEMCNGRIMGDLAQKKKYCKKTYWSVRELASQINILMAFQMEKNKPTKGLVIQTQDILKVCDLLRNQLTELNRLVS